MASHARIAGDPRRDIRAHIESQDTSDANYDYPRQLFQFVGTAFLRLGVPVEEHGDSPAFNFNSELALAPKLEGIELASMKRQSRA